MQYAVMGFIFGLLGFLVSAWWFVPAALCYGVIATGFLRWAW